MISTINFTNKNITFLKTSLTKLVLFLVLVSTLSIESCSKTEIQPSEGEKTAEMLKGVINDKKISSIIILCSTCNLYSTNSSVGLGGRYVIEGGFITIYDYNTTYNLAKLIYYETDTLGRLGLYFQQ